MIDITPDYQFLKQVFVEEQTTAQSELTWVSRFLSENIRFRLTGATINGKPLPMSELEKLQEVLVEGLEKRERALDELIRTFEKAIRELDTPGTQYND